MQSSKEQKETGLAVSQANSVIKAKMLAEIEVLNP